jgi:hypothetical protein
MGSAVITIPCSSISTASTRRTSETFCK